MRESYLKCNSLKHPVFVRRFAAALVAAADLGSGSFSASTAFMAAVSVSASSASAFGDIFVLDQICSPGCEPMSSAVKPFINTWRWNKTTKCN